MTGAFAPVTDGSGGAVATGLTVTSSTAPATTTAIVSGWLANQPQQLDLNSGPAAQYYRNLAEEGTEHDKATLREDGQTTDSLGIDDELLDMLLSGGISR